MAFRQIKSPALGDSSVLNTKLDATAVSGQTAQTSLADLDTLLVHNAAGAALKSITAANIIASFDTDDLSEGTNKYYTDARAIAGVAASVATAVAAEASIGWSSSRTCRSCSG